MRIVWDEAKRRINLATHGLDLADAESFDWEHAIVVAGHRSKDGRPRYRAIGWLGRDVVTIVLSPLGSEAVSVISLRRASRSERRQHGERNT